jgi:hypothetical protein
VQTIWHITMAARWWTKWWTRGRIVFSALMLFVPSMALPSISPLALIHKLRVWCSAGTYMNSRWDVIRKDEWQMSLPNWFQNRVLMIFFSMLSCWELYHKEGVPPKLQIVLVLPSVPQYHNIYNSAVCESFHDWSSKYMRACHMGAHVQVHGQIVRERLQQPGAAWSWNTNVWHFLQQQRDILIIQLHQQLISHGHCLVFCLQQHLITQSMEIL